MLEKVRVVHSILTDELLVARFGKDPGLALEKREATTEILCAVAEYMMDGSPAGASQEVAINGEWFTVSVTPKAQKEGNEDR